MSVEFNRDKSEKGVTVLHAIRLLAQSINQNISLTQQIREAFDEIVELQNKGVSLAAITQGINDSGIKIKIGHLRNRMTKIRQEHETKKVIPEISTPTLPADNKQTNTPKILRMGSATEGTETIEQARENHASQYEVPTKPPFKIKVPGND